VITREQEEQIERLALAHGRVHVRHGYVGGHVEAIVPNGQRLVIQQFGTMVDAGVSYSDDQPAKLRIAA
jgi:hypothetical protein